jgi:hypothetical protein
MKNILKLSLLGAALLAPSSLSATTFADGGFEAQGNGVGLNFCYFPGCPAGAWTGTDGGGIADEQNGAFPGTPTPEGTKYGFIQGTGMLSQTFTAGSSGLFSLSWLDAGRRQAGPNPATTGIQTYSVFLNTVSLGQFGTTTGQLFQERSGLTPFSLVANSAYTLTFAGGTVNGATAYIDRVAFTEVTAAAVPESATWAMLILGFGAVGSAMRRHRRAPQPALA